ncbi:MAG: hypothetical protein GXP34_07385 [Actinobacteria bacterium]|nr:hypothetical protein [Actinomycetota bacterium]
MHETPDQVGLTRREALKRGAAVAGALWAVPIVQVVGLRPAYAQTTSPAWINCDVYCIAWTPLFPERWFQLRLSLWPVLSCPDGVTDALPPQATLDGIVVTGDYSTGFTEQLPDNCRLYGQDPSPDEFSPWSAAARCLDGHTTKVDGSGSTFGDAVFIPACANSLILHIELIIQCCEQA